MSIQDIKLFNGIDWQIPTDIKIYNGIDWVSTERVKIYNGIDWVTVWELGGVTPPTSGTIAGSTIFSIRYYDGSVYIDDTINASFGGNVTFPFNGQDIVSSPDVLLVDEATTTANVVGTSFPWEDTDWNKRHYYNAKMYIGNVEVYSGGSVTRDSVPDINASITITNGVPTYDPDLDPYTVTGADIF